MSSQSELQLRNSQIYDHPSALNLPSFQQEEKVKLDDKGELISEQDLTKNKVKKALLESMLVHSKKLITSSTNQDIKQKMHLIEERAYWKGTTDPNTYFHKLFQQLQQTNPDMPVELELDQAALVLISQYKKIVIGLLFLANSMSIIQQIELQIDILYGQFDDFYKYQEVSDKINAINDKIFGKLYEGDIKILKKNPILNKQELYALESSFFKRRLSNKKLQLEHKINSLDNHIDYLKSLRQPNGQLDKTSISTRAMYKSVHEFSTDDNKQHSEKTLDAKSFLKKIKKEQDQARIEFDDKKRKEEERKRKLEEKIEIERQEERRKRHEELMSTLQSQKENQKTRHEQIVKNDMEFKQFYKNYKEKKPLFEIMEESYKQKAEIEAQQEKLSKLRELYRPHKLEDFEDHIRRYKDFKETEQERIQQKKSAFQSTMSIQSNTSMWRGRVHELVKEQMKTQMRQSASEDRMIRHDRSKQYASMVKLNHIPKPDKEKQDELAKRYTNLKQPKNLISIQLEKQEIQTEPSSSKIGKDYFEFAKKYNREHKKQEDEKVKEQRLQQQSDDINIKKSMQKIHYKNYMKEERVKQVLKKDDPKREWESQINRLQGTEKVEKVLMAAQQLDMQARRKEQMIRNSKKADQSQAEELDDCYFNSIKAKIALLKDFHQLPN